MLVQVCECPDSDTGHARTAHNGGLAAPVALVGQARSLVDGADLREWLSE